jgi:arginine utilization regulatory protein
MIAQLKEEELFACILRNIDIGISVIDENGLFVYYNETMEKIEGIKAEEVIGKHVLEIHTNLNGSSSTLLNCLRTGKRINNRIKVQVNKHGEVIYLVTTNVPIIKEDKIVGAIEYVKNENSFGELYDYLDKKHKGHKKEIKEIKDKDIIKGYTFEDFLTIEKELIILINKIKDMTLYDYNVFISGETGTGKEIIAQSIHNRSQRKNKPFIAQNCAAIPESLLESIFFGTDKGSFTGAVDKMGLFEQAKGGTLLLDELNSLPIYLQAKLLRVLQEGYIRRIGGTEDIPVDVRVIATINEKSELLIKENRLREDLFYRLGPIYINIPPLRERKADIDYLTKVFIKRESKSIKMREPILSKKVKQYFRDYSWVGNVRELKNVVKYIILNSACSEVVDIEHLPYYMKNNLIGKKIHDLNLEDLDYQDKVIEFEKVIINDALKTTKGNVSEASKLLGIKRQTLQYKIKKWQIE